MTSRSPSGMLISSGVSLLPFHCPPSLLDQSFFIQVADDLLHKEGIAFRLAVYRFGQSPGHLLRGNALQHPPDFIGIQTPQEDPPEGGYPSQFSQGGREGMGAVYLHIPVGADNQKPGPGQIAGDMGQHVQGALVGIMQVFQDNQQRLDAGGIGQEGGDRLHQAVPFFFRVFLGPQFYLQSFPDLGDDAGYIGGPGAQLFSAGL